MTETKGPVAGNDGQKKSNAHLDSSTFSPMAQSPESYLAPASKLIDARELFQADETLRAFNAGWEAALRRIAELEGATPQARESALQILTLLSRGER